MQIQPYSILQTHKTNRIFLSFSDFEVLLIEIATLKLLISSICLIN